MWSSLAKTHLNNRVREREHGWTSTWVPSCHCQYPAPKCGHCWHLHHSCSSMCVSSALSWWRGYSWQAQADFPGCYMLALISYCSQALMKLYISGKGISLLQLFGWLEYPLGDGNNSIRTTYTQSSKSCMKAWDEAHDTEMAISLLPSLTFPTCIYPPCSAFVLSIFLTGESKCIRSSEPNAFHTATDFFPTPLQILARHILEHH